MRPQKNEINKTPTPARDEIIAHRIRTGIMATSLLLATAGLLSGTIFSHGNLPAISTALSIDPETALQVGKNILTPLYYANLAASFLNIGVFTSAFLAVIPTNSEHADPARGTFRTAATSVAAMGLNLAGMIATSSAFNQLVYY